MELGQNYHERPSMGGALLRPGMTRIWHGVQETFGEPIGGVLLCAGEHFVVPFLAAF
jgi:hypothetical protein